MKIILLGKQGCGKGTQGKLIARKYKIPLIVTGDMLREISKENSYLGRKIKKILDQGKFVPNKLTNKMILAKIKASKGFVLDGFPRNMEQKEAIQEVKIDVVFLIEISNSVAIKRLSSRRMCGNCNEVYNLLTKKPRQKGICDKCKDKLIQRTDDTEAAIKKRLELYKKETIPVLDFYKKQGILKKVNGENKQARVFRDIQKILIS